MLEDLVQTQMTAGLLEGYYRLKRKQQEQKVRDTHSMQHAACRLL